MRVLCRTLFLAALLTDVLLAAPRLRADWTWELPNERYQRMNMFERAQYDKAASQFRQNSYKSAAAEFEKFKIQFPDSENLPYILFMTGYSHHQDKQRNKAIQIYEEVLDYFGDRVEFAAPALYFEGIAHLDNGDVRQGMELFKEMADDEDYQKHPLAAGAIRQLADNEWRNGKKEAAIKYWKQTCGFAKINPGEAGVARANLTDYYIKERDYAGYEEWLINAENRDNLDHRRWIAQNAWERAWGNFYHDWGKYNSFNRDEKTKDMRAWYDWFKRQKEWYEKKGDLWTYYHNAVYFLSQRLYDRKETRRVIDESMPLHKAIQDPGQRNDRFAWLADRLREGGDWETCEYCITMISDPLYATYKRYELQAAKGAWDDALKLLVQIEQANNQAWSPRAFGEHARVLKDVLGRYEEAIKLYQQINQPPGTLWAIQECYKRWGKLNEALSTLTEIENSFPPDAARAAWHKAWYQHEAGNKAEAVAQAKRILKVYPKTQESSQAHQLLEQYGVATGGGVTEAGDGNE